MTAGMDQTVRIGAAVTAAVEEVFGTVAEVRAAALRARSAAAADVAGGAFPGLAAPLQALLTAPGQLALGLGVMGAPDAGRPEELYWWQLDPVSGGVHELAPDLRPASVGFYDYAAAPWFDVPRRTGARHAVGPHVDVHGTGQYLLTFTAPVVADGAFLGVAGLDVMVSRFEGDLLGRLGSLRQPFLLVNDDGRVVLSTSPWWLVGSLVPPAAAPPRAGTPVPGVPWRLNLVDDAGSLLGG
jgi:hypothetical protein